VEIVDAKILEKMANDPAVSDEEVQKAISEYLDRDTPITAAELAEVDQLRAVLLKKRPALMQRLRDERAKKFESGRSGGCGEGDAGGEPKKCGCCGKEDCNCSDKQKQEPDQKPKNFDDLGY
jgi:hypothetical protein